MSNSAPTHIGWLHHEGWRSHCRCPYCVWCQIPYDSSTKAPCSPATDCKLKSEVITCWTKSHPCALEGEVLERSAIHKVVRLCMTCKKTESGNHGTDDVRLTSIWHQRLWAVLLQFWPLSLCHVTPGESVQGQLLAHVSIRSSFSDFSS